MKIENKNESENETKENNYTIYCQFQCPLLCIHLNSFAVQARSQFPTKGLGAKRLKSI